MRITFAFVKKSSFEVFFFGLGKQNLEAVEHRVSKMEKMSSLDTDDLARKEKGGEEITRRRIFDDRMRNLCWQKADVVPGRHPERWRKDVAGNIVCRRLTRCEGCLCHEYDHIQPYSKGGETDIRNCQILQSRVNRLKGNKDSAPDSLRDFSCDLKFSDRELDVIEMAVYGNVERVGMQCRCKSVAETLGTTLYKAKGSQMSCELPYQGKG